MIAYDTTVPERFRRRMVLLVDSEAGVLVARRDGEQCSVSSFVGVGDRAANEIALFAPGDIVGFAFYGQPIVDLAGPAEADLIRWPDAVLPNGNSIRVSGASAELFAGNIQPIEMVYKFQDGEFQLLASRDHPIANGNPQEVEVWGDHIFWWEGKRGTDIWRLIQWTPERGVEVMLEYADQRAYRVRTDGIDLVWQQSTRNDDGWFRAWEIWTSPYTRDPRELEPRRVRGYFPHDTLAVGGGFAGQFRPPDWNVGELFRLSDGALFERTFDEGELGLRGPLAMSEHGAIWDVLFDGKAITYRLGLAAFERVPD